MRHREAAQNRLAALNVDQDPPIRLVLAPAARDVGLTEGGHVPRLVIDHAEAVQMAAVLRGELRDEWRLPARDEAVLRIEGRKTGEVGRDHPELALGELDLVDPDVPGEVL